MESSDAALVNVLKVELSTSVSFVDDYLVEKLRTLARTTIQRAFPHSPKANETAFIRLLANSLSGTGGTGLYRTQKAMQPLGSTNDQETADLIQSVSTYLRARSTGLRKARTFVAHESKCIRAVLGFVETESELSKVPDDGIRWGAQVADAWLKQGHLDEKNRRLYVSTWMTFIRQAFQSPKSTYSEYLFERVQEIEARSQRETELPELTIPASALEAPRKSSNSDDEVLTSDMSGFVFDSEFPYESAHEASHEPNAAKVYFTPKDYSEAPEIAESYKRNNAVMIDMRLISESDARRIVDFLLGMQMATDGSLKRVKQHIFVLTPKAVKNISFENADAFAFTS